MGDSTHRVNRVTVALAATIVVASGAAFNAATASSTGTTKVASFGLNAPAVKTLADVPIGLSTITDLGGLPRVGS